MHFGSYLLWSGLSKRYLWRSSEKPSLHWPDLSYHLHPAGVPSGQTDTLKAWPFRKLNNLWFSATLRHWGAFAAIIFAGIADGEPAKLYLPSPGQLEHQLMAWVFIIIWFVTQDHIDTSWQSMGLLSLYPTLVCSQSAKRRDFKGDYCDLEPLVGAKQLLRTTYEKNAWKGIFLICLEKVDACWSLKMRKLMF